MGKDFDRFIVTFGIGLIGVVLAVMFYLLNANELIVNEYITDSITIEKLMAITIIFFALIGGIVGAAIE